MGFWGSVGKLIVGKPIFETPPSGRADDSNAPVVDYSEERQLKREHDRGLFDELGHKHIPELAVVHVKTHEDGKRYDVWATVHNFSNRVLKVDKMTLCGYKTKVDYLLQPGDQREFNVYKGPIHKNDGYKRCELYYKDQATGDYFRADHEVHYHFEQATGYMVNGLELIRPIYDI